MNSEELIYRLAQPGDYVAIARLHARNWKEGYRGLCPDQYLDHEVDQDRLNVWAERFATPDSKRHILIAEDKTGQMAGFVCTFLDYHDEWGAYLDNLHVAPGYQGLGIGQVFMHEAAKWVLEHRPDSSLYLHVLKGNTGAIKFYERLKGKFIGEVEVDLPWGGKGLVYDYLWTLDQLIN